MKKILFKEGLFMKLMWLAVAVVFGIGEIITPSLTLIWFSIGAIIMMFLESFIESILIQIILFAIISITMLVIATKKLVKKDENYKYTTNLQGIIAKGGYVKEEILPNKTGIVVIGREEWSAVSFNNEKIEKDTQIEVLKIEGVKLIVKPKEVNQTNI
jgi:membrane protein implicated in regulation of membrane protease activity